MEKRIHIPRQISSYYRVAELLKRNGKNIRPRHHCLYFAILSAWIDSDDGSIWVEIGLEKCLKISGLSKKTFYKTVKDLEAWGVICTLNKTNRKSRLYTVTDLTRNPSRVVRRALFGKY